MKIDLKATRLGRVLRRLAGEEKGAVMMEYVVLAVLLVAAVVAAVIAFSGKIQNQFKAAGEATSGHTDKAATTVSTGADTFDNTMKKAVEQGDKINGGEFKSQQKQNAGG
jgi:Flp pilus assembly pilin Flp